MENLKANHKWIKEFEDEYSCDVFGNFISYKKPGNPQPLKLIAQKSGYLVINIYKDKKRRTLLAHRLLWETFVGPIPKDNWVCFKDGRKNNIRLENLKLISDKKEIDGIGQPSKMITVEYAAGNRRFFGSVHDAGKYLHLDNSTIKKIAKENITISYTIKYT